MHLKFAIAIVLTALATSALALGVGGLGRDFGHLGSHKKGTTSAPVASCSGTGLKFDVACNSQYIGIL